MQLGVPTGHTPATLLPEMLPCPVRRGAEPMTKRVWIIKLRMKLAAWIMGDGWGGVLTRLWLIRARALDAISEDGMVTLAKCPALAETLYEKMPGTWTLTAVRSDPVEP